MDSKICSECKLDLPISLYDSASDGYIRNQCRRCRLAKITASRKARQETVKNIPDTKHCQRCNNNKSSNDFNKLALSMDGLAPICRICFKETRHRKKTLDSTQTDIKSLICEKCKMTKMSSEFKSTKRSKTGFYKICNSCWKPREWNSEKQKESQRKYDLENKDKRRAKWKRDATKPNRFIRDRLNKRIRGALESASNRKSNKTYEYIGCDFVYLKKWFEFQFTDIMGWHNRHEWHIDHVIPCSQFDLSSIEEQKRCFSWKNLRPCMMLENLEKNDKVIPELIENHQKLVSEFSKVNPLPNYPSDSDNGAN